MPFKTSGCLIVYEDGMTELEICRAETYKTADNIAAALNDAIRWRKLCVEVEAGQSVCIEPISDGKGYWATVSALFGGCDRGSRGETIAQAFDGMLK